MSVSVDEFYMERPENFLSQVCFIKHFYGFSKASTNYWAAKKVAFWKHIQHTVVWNQVPRSGPLGLG